VTATLTTTPPLLTCRHRRMCANVCSAALTRRCVATLHVVGFSASTAPRHIQEV
jgi:hypothetical protein